MSLMQLLVALILMLPMIAAHACLPLLLIWHRGVPKPEIVFDGLAQLSGFTPDFARFPAPASRNSLTGKRALVEKELKAL
ncbi:MAG: hypothetical protein JNN30_05945 [Rhodanobacteraceae bacterium]|nr:hypothetical protein [Rhodanobacteraceae bacterium]